MDESELTLYDPHSADLSKVTWIRLIWVDLAGIRRCRVVPYSRWKSIQEHGVGLSASCMAMQCHADAVAANSGLSVVGEVRMFPDAATLCVLPYYPTHAMALVNLYDKPGNVWAYDPRRALRQTLELFSSQFGLEVRAGFEHEFVLLQQPATGPGAHGDLQCTPVDNTAYAQTLAVAQHARVLDAMCEALANIGIEVEQYHAESAPGQFEIVTAHNLAMQAADDVILTREVLCAVALQHGFTVSFLPKLAEGVAGNGLHCHCSLWKDGKNVMAGPGHHGLSTLAASFMMGMLYYLPGFLPFTMASPNSYLRVVPGSWAGAWACWGVHNREAPLRLAGTHDPDSLNVEFKALDATANVHFALAAILLAGLRGLHVQADLPEPVTKDPATLSQSERRSLGIARLPTTLVDAITAYHSLGDEALEQGISRQVINCYLAVKTSEAAFLGSKTVEEQIKLLHDKY